jgi:hypothetical protein
MAALRLEPRHTNPVKGPARDIAIWDQAKLLSTVIDSGAYEQKIIAGTTRKLVFVWLYWTPELPPDLAAAPTPRSARKKGAKKGGSIRSPGLPRNVLALFLVKHLLQSALPHVYRLRRWRRDL